MSKKDFYKVLGVERGATADVIKKAYRKIALDNHPDRNPDNKAAEERFKEAAEAYEILGDAEKKNKYDQFGHAGKGASGMSAEDAFHEFAKRHRDFAGFGRAGNAGQVRGENIRVQVTLTLSETLKGTTKKVKLSKEVACEECDGNGSLDGDSFDNCSECGGSGMQTRVFRHGNAAFQQSFTCQLCGGSGQLIKEKCKKCVGHGFTLTNETVDLVIPKGAVRGHVLNVPNAGHSPRGGFGHNGSLLVEIQEEEDDNLKRDGANVIYDLHIGYADAVLGATGIEVPTIEGSAKINLEPGTENGKILRLKGKGIPDISSDSIGDQLVYVNIFVPKKVTEEESKILEKMRKKSSFKPGKEQLKHTKGIFHRIREYFMLHAH